MQTKFKQLNMEGRARYNDVELAEFKQLIEEKLKLATREYDQLMDSLIHQSQQMSPANMPI